MSAAVRAGYKLTEVGVIPEDWEVFSIGEIADTSSGTTPARELANLYYRNGTIHWVKTLDLNNSYIRNTDEKVTLTAVDETSLRSYPIGTVLVAMYGGFNQIGRTGLLGVPAAVNQAITAVQPHATKIQPEYLLAMLNFRVNYWKTVASSSRKDPNITSQDVRAFPIAFPPLPEQHAIATALSDVDALLAKLEALVAKKRDLKTATMQQLLTGQTRLPGFSGAWEVKRLGDVLSRMANGAVYKPTSSRGIQITRIETIADGTIDFSRTGVAEYSPELDRYKLIPGDILFSHINSVDHIGKVAIFIGEQPLYHGMNLLLLRTNKDVDGNFLYFWFTSLPARRQTRNMAKQAVSQASINTKELKALEILLPPMPEQTAIATLLCDIDAELTALEARRDKTRALKQGMMQTLLTGRIRLIASGD